MVNSDDELTISLDDLTDDSTTIDITSSINNYSFSSIGAQGSSGSYYVSTGAGANGTWAHNPYVFTTNNTGNVGIGTTSPAGIHVTSDAKFDGDIKWKGRSLGELLTTIEKRLAILTPDPAKLEHFEALQKAYQHYKTLEALCKIPEKKDDGS
jgi:protein involved in polysaccharide export with SLBB domain